ncbi:MAG TPA: phosphoribosylaminoimidazolesuccinocarboxamide synthase, partial [Bacteroidetes bacterium]|nr:phosphoribosylaminoimidazolesuccinocarboxamide synthase [Bacteroidota bacterium]
MEKTLIYEGKAKKIYKISGNDDAYLQEFKDDATAFNGVKKDQIRNKGIVNNLVTSVIFGMLNKSGIKTHFIEKVSDNSMLVSKVEIIKVEVVCRNIAAGSLVKKFGFKEGESLKNPLVEFYYKSDELGDPLFSEDHIIEMNLATKDELDYIRKETLKINSILIPYFLNKGLKLVDFKLEFGKNQYGEIILADEISPDTCRLWDKETNKKMDKDRFRFDLGEVEESYEEVMR